jgi:hypothetical protein
MTLAGSVSFNGHGGRRCSGMAAEDALRPVGEAVVDWTISGIALVLSGCLVSQSSPREQAVLGRVEPRLFSDRGPAGWKGETDV